MVVTALAGVALTGTLLAGVEFGGAHACPTPADVAQAFADIQPLMGEEFDPNETVQVDPDRDGTGAIIRFRSAGPDPFAERLLPADLSCAERAESAAIIVARYLVTQSDALTFPQKTVSPFSSRDLAKDDEPRFSERLMPPFQAEDELAAAAVTASASNDTTPALFALEVGLQGGAAGAWFARGLRAGFAHRLADGQLRLGVGGVKGERADYYGGRETWSRAMVSLGYAQPIAVFEHAATFVEAGADLVASRLQLEREDGAFHPGFAAALRIGHPVSPEVALWGSLGANLWLRPQRTFGRAGQSLTMPPVEVLATLGATWSTR